MRKDGRENVGIDFVQSEEKGENTREKGANRSVGKRFEKALHAKLLLLLLDSKLHS